MKNPLKTEHLPYLSLGFGAVGFALMLCLRLTGVDGKGLLLEGHWAGWLSLGLAAVATAVTVLLVRPLEGKMKYKNLFPGSIPAAAGNAAAAVGVAVNALPCIGRSDTLNLLCGWVGLLAAVCFAVLAYCRFTHRRPNFLLHFVISVYLMLHLLLQYQVWSAQAQLLRYLFPMLASLAMTFAAYYATALDVSLGSRKGYLLGTQLGVVFSLMALPWGEELSFYLGFACWALTDLCSLHILRSHAPEGNDHEAA